MMKNVKKNVRMAAAAVMRMKKSAKKRSAINATQIGRTLESEASASISRKGKADFFCFQAVTGQWEQQP